MTCEVTHTIHESGTSLLHVKLDDYHSKCLHSFANPPEDWVENIISSRCQPLCHKLWECHIKECCKHDNMEKKTSKAMLILGYEPDPELIFEPVGKCVDNEDGSCVIEVEIDGMYTKKIQELLPDLSQEVKSMICDNVDLEAEAILDKVASRGEHINKSKREIVLEYQREEIAEPEVEDTPFVDQTAEDLQTTDANLQTTRTELTETKADLQTTRTELTDAKTDLEEKTYQIISLEARLAALEQKFISN